MTDHPHRALAEYLDRTIQLAIGAVRADSSTPVGSFTDHILAAFDDVTGPLREQVARWSETTVWFEKQLATQRTRAEAAEAECTRLREQILSDVREVLGKDAWKAIIRHYEAVSLSGDKP